MTKSHLGPIKTCPNRALAVLGLFSVSTPLIAVEEISARLGYSRATAYRYLRDLTGAGLISQATPGAYGLGPAIIELERLVALTDPLYLAGQEVLAEEICENSALLLHNIYNDKVLCIYKQGPDILDCYDKKVKLRRVRGMPFPLFQGAASLALLPHLPPHRIRQTYLRNHAQISAAGLGHSWEDFRSNIFAIRRCGYASSEGTITPFLSGVAVPILHNDRLVGSIARAYPTDATSAEREHILVADLQRIGNKISRLYERSKG